MTSSRQVSDAAAGGVPKRTRICGPQSKNGCLTCKDRRIKCDEEKPFCQRCRRSNRDCEGYSTRATSQDKDTRSFLEIIPTDSLPAQSRQVVFRASSPSLALSDGFAKNSQQDRLARLGCCILQNDPYDQYCAGRSIFQYLLPQLSHAIPTVNAAAAALGASFEIQLTSSVSGDQESIAASQYSIALRAILRDLANQPHGPVPLLLACGMLAWADIIQRRQNNAMLHFQGALNLLQAQQRSLLPRPKRAESNSSGEASMDTEDSQSEYAIEDEVALLFRTLDVDVASYILGRPPDLPESKLGKDISEALPPMTSVRDAGNQLIPFLHSCYHFTAAASEYKYSPRTAIPSSILRTQSRHIARLSQWLENLDHGILSQDNSFRSSAAESTHGLKLRVQCLVTIIYVSTVLNAHEVDYDFHASRFQQIVIDASTIVSRKSPRPLMVGIERFSTEPGIIQPLFFTATKYRHPAWRRRAKELLLGAGREGPNLGRLLAAVAAKAVTIEEETVVIQQQQSLLRLGPSAIPEKARLHGCGMDAEAVPNGRDTLTVTFSRCIDVDKMINPKPSTSRAWDDKSNWDIWAEVLEFSSAVATTTPSP